jgi:hypothetical protein
LFRQVYIEYNFCEAGIKFSFFLEFIQKYKPTAQRKHIKNVLTQMCSEQAKKARNKASKNKNPLLSIAETNNLDIPDSQGMQKIIDIEYNQFN